MKISDLMRLGSVTRFHLVRTHRSQTVAEHQYRVWSLVQEMLDRLGMPRYGNAWLNACTLALIHDTAESVLGDPPTPYKEAMRFVFGPNASKLVEAGINKAHDELYAAMAEDMPEMLVLVKVADVLESAIFLRHEGITPHESRVCGQLLNSALNYADDFDNHPGSSWKLAGLRLVAAAIFQECTA